MRRKVATHKKPDPDAIVATWLVERYLFKDEKVEVVFVELAYSVPDESPFDCIVDVGRTHDPARLLFDHKPPAFVDRNQTCATKLLWEHLLAQGKPVGALAELVEAVHDGDSVKRRGSSAVYKRSRKEGLHAEFAQARRSCQDDLALYRSLRCWLNEYAKFRDAVESIVVNCGEDVRSLLLSGHEFLTKKAIMSLSRTSPERQRFEMAQVQRGRRPFSLKSTVFDTTSYAEVCSRLARAGGFVNQAAQLLRRLQRRRALHHEDLTGLLGLVQRSREKGGQLHDLIQRGYAARPAGVADSGNGFSWRPPKTWPNRFLDRLTVTTVRSSLTRANSFVEKCVRDLGDTEVVRQKQLWPSREEMDSCCTRLDGMSADLQGMIAVIQTTKSEHGGVGRRGGRARSTRR
jgi:hypothetical protein